MDDSFQKQYRCTPVCEKTVGERLGSVWVENQWECLGVEALKKQTSGKSFFWRAHINLPGWKAIQTYAAPQGTPFWRQGIVMIPENSQRWDRMGTLSSRRSHKCLSITWTLSPDYKEPLRCDKQNNCVNQLLYTQIFRLAQRSECPSIHRETPGSCSF